MAHEGKRFKTAAEGIDRKKLYALGEALTMVRSRAKAKFDETIEVAMNLGVDPRHADQMVRGVVNLPNGTGKNVRVAVFAKDAKADEARKAGADIVGVSADPVKAQDKFRDKYSLTIALASDEAKKMLTAYGVWGEKSMYGRKFMGVRRTTLLIDAKGRVAQVWENVKVPGHAEAVLEAAKAL